MCSEVTSVIFFFNQKTTNEDEDTTLTRPVVQDCSTSNKVFALNKIHADNGAILSGSTTRAKPLTTN